MKNNHQNTLLFWTGIVSTVVSICVIALGICYGRKLQKEQEESERYTIARFEMPESREMMMVMRIHTLEQEVDMLRLRIEEIEENNGITNEAYSVCEQFYIHQSETNNIVEWQEKDNRFPLAIDDLIDDLVSTNSL